MNVAVRNPPGGGSGQEPQSSSGGPPPPPPRPPLQRRSSDREFREVLGVGLAIVRNLITVAIFSFAVNTLLLAIPIYLFNVSDRVLTSRSTDTLTMLTIVAVGALLVHVVLDMIRRFMLMRIAVDVESKLGAPVLSAAAKASQNGSSREFQTLGDLQQLRAFITGSVLLTMLDAPVAPLYLLVVFLIHPHLGWIVATSGVLLLVIATINQRTTAMPFGISNAFATRANLQADAMARNAQVINAMGMIPEAVADLGARHRRVAEGAGHGAGPQRHHDRHLQVRAPVHAGGDPRMGRMAGPRRRAHGRHDDRRLDRREPRAGAG